MPQMWRHPGLHTKRKVYSMRNETQNYGALSFTGEPSQGPFDAQILEGKKTQTIRHPRIDGRPHVKVGSTTKLYWKMRRMKEGGYLIGYAEILAYEELTLLDMWFDEENAKADGFKDLEEFYDWFWDHKKTGVGSWSQVNPVIKEAVKTATMMDRGITENMIFAASGRAAGKSTTMRIVEYLLEPVYRIKWKYPLIGERRQK